MKSIDRKTLVPLLGVTAVFIISRVLYDQAGIRFQGHTYLSYWQFMDPVLLRTDVWRSVYYLHSQPPLLNLFTGIVLQLFPANHTQVFHTLFFITGLILTVSLYWLGLAMQFPRWLSALLSIWFVLSPGTVLYEHWLTYVLPLPAALTLAGAALYQFVRTQKIGWGVLFFSLLASIALTWSLFHIIWLYAVTVLLLVLLRNRKKVILAALVPFLLVTGWYGKNLYLVGEFTSSSWAGMNLSRITTFRTSQKLRKELIRMGVLSKFALLPPFRNPSVYLELLPDTPLTGIPLWDEPDTSLDGRNHHHLVYVEASQFYLRDALRVIRLRPDVYARSIWQAIYIYFHSPSDFDLTASNRTRIRELDQWWNRLFYGQWKSNETSFERIAKMSPEHVGWVIVIGFVTSLVGGLIHVWRNRGQLAEPMNLLILFMLINIIFVTIVGNLMDIGENNRFRYVVDPFIWTLFVFFLRNWLSRLSPVKPKTSVDS